MSIYLQRSVPLRIILVGLLALGSAWLLVLRTPLTCYTDLNLSEGQFFTTHHRGFLPLYILLVEHGTYGAALLLGGAGICLVMTLFYGSTLTLLLKQPTMIVTLWQSTWHWLILGFTWLGLLLAYPLLSDDPMHYLQMARLTWLYGINPYITMPDFLGAGDQWYRVLGVTQHINFGYGPVALYSLLPAVLFTPNSLGGALFALRITNIIQLGLCFALIRSVAGTDPRPMYIAIIALCWHPVVLLEIIWNGHNDITMMLWVVAALVAQQRKHIILMGICLAAGVLTKYLPALFIPLFLAATIRHTSKRSLVLAAIGAILVVLVCYAPFILRHELVAMLSRPAVADRNTASVGLLIVRALQPLLGNQLARLVPPGILLSLTGWLTWKVWRGMHVAEAVLWLVCSFMFVTNTWYFPWYGVWPLLLAPLVQPWLRNAVLFAALLLPLYYVINLVPLPTWFLAICYTGLPLLVVFRAWITQRRKLMTLTSKPLRV